MSAVTLVIAVVIGLAVGVLSGMLGVGGGTIMVPVFRLGFGLSAIQATATSLFAIIPTSIAGLVQHIRNGTCIIPLGIVAGVGGALTSPLGAQLASLSPGWLIMLATGAVIIYSSSTMLRKGLAMPKPGAQVAGKSADQVATQSAGQPSAVDGSVDESTPDAASNTASSAAELHLATSNANTLEQNASEPDLATPMVLSRTQLAIGGAIGLAAGLAAGYVGLGGGFLMVPLFVSILGVPMKRASGTSLLSICLLSITGVVRHMMLGNVVVVAGLALAAGTVPGALLGATLVKYVPERTLRLFFGAFLIVVALFLIVNEFVVAGA